MAFMFGNDFQRKLLHHFPTDCAAADKPVVSQILLLALPEDGSNIHFVPVLRNLSRSP